MVASYNNKTISAMYSVLPTRVIDFMDEADNYSFSESQEASEGDGFWFQTCGP